MSDPTQPTPETYTVTIDQLLQICLNGFRNGYMTMLTELGRMAPEQAARASYIVAQQMYADPVVRNVLADHCTTIASGQPLPPAGAAVPQRLDLYIPGKPCADHTDGDTP